MTATRARELVGYGLVGAAMAIAVGGWQAFVAAGLLALAISLIVTPRR